MLVEAVQDYAIFMLNPEGMVSSWNIGAERIKGYKAEEIMGSTSPVFIPKKMCETVSHSGNWLSPPKKDGSRTKAGGSARTGPGFGRT